MIQINIRIAKSVQQLTKGWMVHGSNSPVEAIFSLTIQTSPKVLLASCTMETRYLSLG